VKSNNEIASWNISSIALAIKERRVSPIEVTKKLLTQIKNNDQKINAFTYLLEEQALLEAKQAEKEITNNNIKSPLHGVPIGVKDIVYTKGINTTMGSKVYKNFIPSYNASVIKKLKQSGAIIIGKLNTHEFANGTTGDKSYFGPVSNPYNIKYISGGSSSGSSAAVASLMCYGSIGTDTGGSIRIPSSFCGLVGMKPTFGRVSKYGVFPLSWTLDHVGPITRTTKDNAILLNALSGYDKKDPYSIKTKTEDFTRYLNTSIKNLKIGLPYNFYFENIDERFKKIVLDSLQTFKYLGTTILPIDIPNMQEKLKAFRLILESEAYAKHGGMIEKNKNKIGKEVQDKFIKGKNPYAYEYASSQNIKQEAIQTFNSIFENVDIILTPTVPCGPIKIGERLVSINEGKFTSNTILNKLTGITNMTRHPSLTIPCGTSESGFPIGLQLIERKIDEANLYRVGHSFEQEFQGSQSFQNTRKI